MEAGGKRVDRHLQKGNYGGDDSESVSYVLFLFDFLYIIWKNSFPVKSVHTVRLHRQHTGKG